MENRYWEPFTQMYIEKPKGYDNQPFIDIPKIIRIARPVIKKWRRHAPRKPLKDTPLRPAIGQILEVGKQSSGGFDMKGAIYFGKAA